jgi:S-adenosylmethionine:tRNA ribosyltransferase-isomerase
MMHPKEISIKDYTYSLPEEKIARYPLEKRDDSKLLLYKNGLIKEDVYRNIADHLPENSLLIFNNSKVVEARLIFQKPTGGVIEIFCLEPHEQYAGITTAMLQKGKVVWKCLVGGASKWKRGQQLIKEIKLPGGHITLHASYIKQDAGSFIIELSWQPLSLSFAEVLHYTGAIPLPPYLKRNAEKSDAERYQTIYALHDGSVAAPTAGLHFTDKIFEDLKTKNIQTDFVTLHVGAGTFKPVKTDTMDQHEMHAEYIDVNKKTIENILLNLTVTITAVGTTSLRTLESLYWLGVKNILGNSPEENSSADPGLHQWEAYDLATENIPAKDSLQSLLKWMNENKLDRLITKTQIIIAPGYKPKIAKALLTNFHQPQSTLLLLVAAMIGNDWRAVYNYALQNEFRFLSYGDGSLLWINQD